VTGSYAQDTQKTIHVYVALCDNEHQGVIPVPKILGNGIDPDNNLYWGAMYGVKTYFKRSTDWQLLKDIRNSQDTTIMERCIFKNRSHNVILVADAYKGEKIRDAIINFLESSSGLNAETLQINTASEQVTIAIGGSADLLAYVGHDGLMDFAINYAWDVDTTLNRNVIILACASKTYFGPVIYRIHANPILWTTGLMAPEAYSLKAAIDGWILGEKPVEIRNRAASAYSQYQRCTLNAALNLFVTGW